MHGILNIVGWGGFLPFGVIIARYYKYPLEIKKGGFILHVSCQIIGYILGTIGWIIGLGLGSASKFYIFRTHRLYAMFIFAFTTLQVGCSLIILSNCLLLIMCLFTNIEEL